MIFINNKYTKWYYQIIDNAKNREVEQELYLEKHHIVPKSLGGSNKKENIVRLTAREHFVCHLLLPKMLYGESRAKMVYALWHMTNQKNEYQTERYTVTSKTYEIVRKQFSQTHSKRMKESHPFKRNPENLKKLLEGIKRRGPTSRKGVKQSEETKEKLRNKVWTEKAIKTRLENCLKSAARRKGKKNPTHGKKIFENYVNNNREFIIEVWKLFDMGINRRQISLRLDVSYERVDLAIKKRESISDIIKLNNCSSSKYL